MNFLKDVLTITMNISILAIKNSQPLNLNAGLVTEHLKASAWSWSIIPFLFCLIKMRLCVYWNKHIVLLIKNNFCWLKTLPVSHLFAAEGLVSFPKPDHSTSPPHISLLWPFFLYQLTKELWGWISHPRYGSFSGATRVYWPIRASLR